MAGLTLYDVATMISRSDFEVPSILEMLCAQAKVWCKAIKNNARRVERFKPESFKETDSEAESDFSTEKRLSSETASTVSSPIEIIKQFISDDSTHIITQHIQLSTDYCCSITQ